MVKQRVTEAHTSEWDKEIRKALGKAEKVSLHHIRSKETIDAICEEVISRVDGAGRLVHITSEILESLKQDVKKKVIKNLIRSADLEHSEEDKHRQDRRIRKDWDTKKWKENAPHGWAWRQKRQWKWKNGKTKKEVIALVYQTLEQKDPDMFLDREIIDHPRGALVLIENMKKRHDALMVWDKNRRMEWI